MSTIVDVNLVSSNRFRGDLFWRICMRRTAVVALGGNAFTREWQRGTYAEQASNALAMAHSVYALIRGGWNIAIVHGNGPQVGSLAIQQEESAALVPAQPLFALGAMTEAQLGSMIALSLRHVSRGQVEAVAVVTHTVVSMEDPAFLKPTKPIGPFLTAKQAKELADTRGWTIAEDSGRGYRRIVPSPKPVSIIESAAIRSLIASGAVVIAAGGGGIPVAAAEDGYVGVDAVVDKDYAAEQLGTSIGADTLILVTGVEQVQLNFGTPQQRPLDLITSAEAERWLADGQFPEGSMGPKVHAAIRFLKNAGRRRHAPRRHHHRFVRLPGGGEPMTKTLRLLPFTYADSVVQLAGTRAMYVVDGVEWAAAAMATRANVSTLADEGFDTSDLDSAGANDLFLAVRANSDAAVNAAFDAAQNAMFRSRPTDADEGAAPAPRTLRGALDLQE